MTELSPSARRLWSCRRATGGTTHSAGAPWPASQLTGQLLMRVVPRHYELHAPTIRCRTKCMQNNQAWHVNLGSRGATPGIATYIKRTPAN